MKIFILCIVALRVSTFATSSSQGMSREANLVIKNRVLVTVMNKPISVLDVVKKMNVALEQHYPEYKNVAEARFQFYNQQWKGTLLQMIDAELMLKDAEKLELKITDAEVREEIYSRFGPNIMQSLTSIGITYEEAKKMVYTDIATQRMMWFRVHSKALSSVFPDAIRESYKNYLTKNPSGDVWTYEVLSLRAPVKESSSLLATKAMDLLNASKVGLKEAALAIQQEKDKDQTVQVSVSEIITAKDHELSSAYKEVLSGLSVGAYSAPVEQVAKNGKDKVTRVFHLIGKDSKEPEKFTNLAEQFKDNLIQQNVAECNRAYLVKLRAQYGFKDLSFIDKLDPFALEP